MRFHSLAEWLQWQESLHPSAIEMGLERVSGVWRRMRPEGLGCRVVTVGGTNGKGSSVAMISAIAESAGYRAARTYTVSHLGAREELGFDVWAGVMDQVSRGSAQEDPDCNTAIATTAGLVLRYEDREIEAFYSAACGGTTSQIEEVWPRPPTPP